jgi:uncharacterized protein (DUF697 family)
MQPSDYENRALRKIRDWKDPKPGRFQNTIAALNWPVKKAGDAVSRIPGFDRLVEKTVGGLIRLLNDFAQWSVRPETIFTEYRAAGHEVNSSTDILKLDLEDVDQAIGRLGAKYKVLATGEGVATGAAGIIGLPADIVALTALSLRAIGEYATYCGFDVSRQEERLFAVHILNLASSSSERAKQKAFTELVHIAKDVASKKVLKDVQGGAFLHIIESVAKSLGLRLTRGKLAQIVPVAGAVVGGGTNAAYMAEVCTAAHNLYCERFLAERYGEEFIETTEAPAKDLYFEDGDGD